MAVPVSIGMALLTPSAAQAENSSGSQSCPGGPTNYAGVSYQADDGNGGQIIFTNPDTEENIVYDMWDYGPRATVYSPWYHAQWWVEAKSVDSAHGVCAR